VCDYGGSLYRFCSSDEDMKDPIFTLSGNFDVNVVGRNWELNSSQSCIAIDVLPLAPKFSMKQTLKEASMLHPSILQDIPSSKEHSSSLSFCPLAVTLEKIINQKKDISAMNAMRR
jgi:hypothetical protein